MSVDLRHYRGQHLGYLPDRILEELSAGPMTAAGLAMFLEASQDSVDRALYRLRARGLVASHRLSPAEPNVWRRLG